MQKWYPFHLFTVRIKVQKHKQSAEPNKELTEKRTTLLANQQICKHPSLGDISFFKLAEKC